MSKFDAIEKAKVLENKSMVKKTTNCQNRKDDLQMKSTNNTKTAAFVGEDFTVKEIAFDLCLCGDLHNGFDTEDSGRVRQIKTHAQNLKTSFEEMSERYLFGDLHDGFDIEGSEKVREIETLRQKLKTEFGKLSELCQYGDLQKELDIEDSDKVREIITLIDKLKTNLEEFSEVYSDLLNAC